MGSTIIEKILARRAGLSSVTPGDIVVAKVDSAVLIDMNFLAGWWAELNTVWDPERVVIIYDHLVPAKDILSAEAHRRGREFAERFGITRVHDVGRDQGIVHQIIADEGYALPGEILLCIDSHTCSGGAFNAAARGMGPTEMIYVVAKGETWFKVCPTVRYELVGECPPWVTAKDIFLYQAGRFGSHAGESIEYGGPAMQSLNVDQRRTISTMSAELSAEFAIWDTDDVLLDYLRDVGAAEAEPVAADTNAAYKDVRQIDLSQLEPYVGLADTLVNNTIPAAKLDSRIDVDQCFIGSCANGTLEDLRIAASVVDGRSVAGGVRFIVTPGSQTVYREALKRGYIETLVTAGALVTTSACGACAGLDMGVLAAGETCITASTRNFKGRMGSPDARIFVGSPATVAASAISGQIVDPRSLN